MVRLAFASITIALSLLLTPAVVHADILFEGYSKIYSGGVHVGFVVNRYEFDAKKKQFVSLSLIKTNELGGNITESVRAYAKDDLTPISYEYTSLTAGKAKTIDAKFNKNKMAATIKEGDKVSKVNIDLPKGSFLSTFLVYVIMKGPKGMAVDAKYDYQAIAEEDASLVKGMAYVKSKEEQNGVKVFKVLNEFKGTKFISFVTEKGEILSTKSPVESISTELVPLSSTATSGFQVPTSLLKQIFGDVPLGVANEISRRYQNNPKGFQSNEGVSSPSTTPAPSAGAPAATIPPAAPSTTAPAAAEKGN